MTPFTHLFVGWTVADHCKLDERDRAIVTWAGVAADADGLTLLPDLFTQLDFEKSRPGFCACTA